MKTKFAVLLGTLEQEYDICQNRDNSSQWCIQEHGYSGKNTVAGLATTVERELRSGELWDDGLKLLTELIPEETESRQLLGGIERHRAVPPLLPD